MDGTVKLWEVPTQNCLHTFGTKSNIHIHSCLVDGNTGNENLCK